MAYKSQNSESFRADTWIHVPHQQEKPTVEWNFCDIWNNNVEA